MFEKIYIQKEITEKNKAFCEFLNKELGGVPIVTDCGDTEYNGNVLCIGNTKAYLKKASNGNAVIAVLDSKEDLFGFTYAVEDVYSIDYEYVEMIHCRFFNIPYVICETERLVIKEMDLDKAVQFFSLTATNPEIFAEEDNNRNDIIERAQSYIDNVYKFYGYGIWAVYEKKSDKNIGFMGLYNGMNDGKSNLYLSYYVKSQERRCGYGYEACHNIIKYVKERLEADNIYCEIKVDNIISINMANKLGFKIINKIEKNKEMFYLLKV